LNLKDLNKRQEKDGLEALDAFREKYPGMQLLVYLMLLGREKGKPSEELDAAYVFLRERNKPMVQGIFATAGRNSRPFPPEERQLAMDAFSADLQEVLRDLYSREYFTANPGDDHYCSYCPFRLPCGNL